MLYLFLSILQLALRIYLFIWIIFCVMSWFGALDTKLGRIIGAFINPLYNKLQELFPDATPMMISFAMMILMFFLSFLS